MIKRLVLGVESSCDDTGVAVVDAVSRLLISQRLSTHLNARVNGGIVPSLARKAHSSLLPQLVNEALMEARASWRDLEAVAVVVGPGLPGSLRVAREWLDSTPDGPRNRYAVNHLQAHALMPRMENRNLQFPYVCLLASGGHTQLLSVAGPSTFEFYGGTLDDPLGESLDKAARMLKLRPEDVDLPEGSHPGAVLEAYASRAGACVPLPRPLARDVSSCNLSFSGLKSSLSRLVSHSGGGASLSHEDRCIFAASYQNIATEHIRDRTARAVQIFRRDHGLSMNETVSVAVTGGCARNSALHSKLSSLAGSDACGDIQIYAPSPPLCSDNGVMVAWTGVELLNSGRASHTLEPDAFLVRPKWPLVDLAHGSQLHATFEVPKYHASLIRRTVQ